MALVVSSGKARRPVARRLVTPRCAAHAVHAENCHGCRRAVVFAVVARERELAEFRTLMGAPRRVRD